MSKHFEIIKEVQDPNRKGGMVVVIKNNQEGTYEYYYTAPRLALEFSFGTDELMDDGALIDLMWAGYFDYLLEEAM